jgi:ATP-binding cassette subfamily B protein
MGYVPQDVFLFSDTIASNIRFGNPGAGNDALEKAGIQAHLTESIERFEHKYETLIGERGITLSGGQKQRLAIARALILQPRILILDDCLSAVDTNTENIILNHLKEEMQGKTTLIISHRISSVKMADHILVLDNGSIIQKGSHESLMAVPGVYKELYERQLVTAEEE